MKRFKLKKIANHWYPCISHNPGYLVGFNTKIDRYLNSIDLGKFEEFTVEFEELGLECGINTIYFNDEDITRYLMTDDNFEMRFMINEHNFTISSDLYFLLEDVFNFNFHKSTYRLHIF